MAGGRDGLPRPRGSREGATIRASSRDRVRVDRSREGARGKKGARSGAARNRLAREWKGQMQRVAVMADGFAWNGTTYSSQSRIACIITGTHWNGPKFFGWRDKPAKG